MAENQVSNPGAADILVVDDDIASLRWLAEILSQAGYRVRQADGPEAVLQAARAHPPSLILLGLSLPGKSSFEVCRRLKQDERTPDVPVIFVSASQDLKDRVQGFEVGLENAYHKLLEGQESGVLPDFRIVTQSGDSWWLAVQGARIEWEGRPARMATIKDTTERKRAEEALRESEERHRALLEQAQDGIVVLQDGRIRFANP